MLNYKIYLWNTAATVGMWNAAFDVATNRSKYWIIHGCKLSAISGSVPRRLSCDKTISYISLGLWYIQPTLLWLDSCGTNECMSRSPSLAGECSHCILLSFYWCTLLLPLLLLDSPHWRWTLLGGPSSYIHTGLPLRWETKPQHCTSHQYFCRYLSRARSLTWRV